MTTGSPPRESIAPQPEMARGLEAAARSGGRKPDAQGTRATPETAPQPGPIEPAERRAAEILEDAAERDTRGQGGEGLAREAGPVPAAPAGRGPVPDPSL
ncbi:hypothetical protein [Methylobacterium crusticola]|nr:hypothetical protein [Methylobacterium crusticola]